jgi:uncharacterized RDD family membrane protein YckC
MSCSNCGEATPPDAPRCPACGMTLTSGPPPPQPSWDPPGSSSWDPPPPAASWDPPPPAASWGPPPGEGGNEAWGGPPGGPAQTPWGAPGAAYTPYPAGYNDPAVGSSGRLAGWWQRVGATILDGIIVWVPARIIEAASGRVLYSLFLVFATLIYTSVLLVTRGQTIGMMAVGTKCVTERSGSYLTYGPAVGRWAITEVLAVTIIGGLLDVLWPLWDGNNQTLHDKVVHTLVVRAR